jgi:hypothetical protein
MLNKNQTTIAISIPLLFIASLLIVGIVKDATPELNTNDNIYMGNIPFSYSDKYNCYYYKEYEGNNSTVFKAYVEKKEMKITVTLDNDLDFNADKSLSNKFYYLIANEPEVQSFIQTTGINKFIIHFITKKGHFWYEFNF